MKNKFIKISFSFLTLLLMFSCAENDDYTNDSVLSVSSPALTVSLGFSNSQTIVEQEVSYDFTVSISETQSADVVVFLEQTDGTATAGEDFTMPSSLTIKKGTLSASDVISIHADELIEDTETVTIQIGSGNESNVSGVSNQTVSFEIANLTAGDLVVGMSWSASSTVTDNYGNQIDAYDLADLRLLLTDSPYTTVYESADGAGAETYVLSGNAPDAEYSFVADFYAAMTEIPADIDITLTFNQVGTINGQTHSFVAALNTADSCADLNYVMAKVTKTGNSYSFEEVGEKSAIDLNLYVGTWTGSDMWGSTEVTTTLNADGKLEITGVGVTFMNDGWGEIITEQMNVVMDVNASTGEFSISEQYYMTTTYKGDVQPVYNLLGTGTIDPCTKTMDLVYDFIQAGTSYTDWLTQYGYVFHEINVLN